MASKTRTPPTPDYSGAADQQAADSKAAWTANLQANRPNQNNQYGSSSWAQGPDGQWTQSTQLNDQQQNIFNSQQNNQQAMAGKIGGMLGGFDNSQISFDGAPGIPSSSVDYASLGGAPGKVDYSSLGGTPGAVDYGALGKIPGAVDYGSLGKMPDVVDYSKLGGVPGAVDYSSLGNIPQVGQYNQQATDLYNQLAQPQLDRTAAARRAQAAAMGISDMTSRAGSNMEQQLADMTSRSGMMGAQAGIEQGNKMFGQGMQAYGQGARNLENQFSQGMDSYSLGARSLENQFGQGMDIYGRGAQNLENQFDQSKWQYGQGVNNADSNYAQNLKNYGIRQGNLNANYDQDMSQYGIRQGQAESNWRQQMDMRKQGVSDILNQRGANLEQLQGLMGLGQEVGTPQFDNFYTGGAYDTPDRMEALKQQYQGQLNTTNAKNADRSGNLSTLGTVASIGATLF